MYPNYPGYGAPGYGTPGYGAPGYGAPGYGAPGYGTPGYGAQAYGMHAQNPYGNYGYDPYGYRGMNFGAYQMGRYGITHMHISTHAAMLFAKYDINRSFTLEVPELIMAINEFMAINGLPPVPQQDIMYLLYTFDFDGTGRIDYAEFKKILKSLGGIKHYSHHSLSEKRMRRMHKRYKHPHLIGNYGYPY